MNKKPEGIALLSIYGDEDDDIDVAELSPIHENQPNKQHDLDTINNNHEIMMAFNASNDNKDYTPPILIENSLSTPPKHFNFGTSASILTPLHSQLSPSDSNIGRRSGRLTIVDYAHDEVALSPEPQDGEVTTGHVMFGAELQMVTSEFQEKTPPGNVHVITPITQATPPLSSEQYDPSQSDAMNCAVNESESAEIEEALTASVEEPKCVDLLDKFLPPLPKTKCSDELQEKIIKFLSLKKKTGRSFNAEVRNRKEYRNPDFLLHAVTYQDIDQIGSCFSKDVFDPHGYDKADYYDEIEADMKREMERKEQERKKSQKIEYISGGIQPGTVVPSPKVNMPIPGVSTAGGGVLHSALAANDAVDRDGRQNKKSKWDKVDGDRRDPLPTVGKDSISAVGAHAALLSVANAGTGYTAFAQQRRREADEKRPSDKKLDRRS